MLGGCARPYSAPCGDEVGGKVVQKELKQPADYLLGWKTFELWASFWPELLDLNEKLNEKK